MQGSLNGGACADLAMLRGCKGPVAIAEFGRDYGAPLAQALGFLRGKTPAASCLSRLFCRLDAVAFEAAPARWIASRSPAPSPGDADQEQEPVALDGKTLRGSRDGTVPGQHLVAAHAPLVEAVLVQVKVDAKTNEHKAALQWLGILPVKGNILTGDAMFCQRDLCAAIIAAGGDYVFTVKDNQPSLVIDSGAGLSYQEQAQRLTAAFSP
jgi:Transposase DDE domain